MNTGPILRFLGWGLLPDLITNFVMRGINHFSNHPIPPDTIQYRFRRQLVLTGVLVAYLVFVIVAATEAVKPNFYQMLGGASDMDEQALNRAFRKFAVKNHPDHAGNSSEDLWIAVRAGYEALKSPNKRFVYDRFGPDFLQLSAETKHQYLIVGLQQAGMLYGWTGAMLILVSLVEKHSANYFWRFMFFVACAALEFFLVVRPTPLVLMAIFPGYLPFQIIGWLRQVAIGSQLALQRIGDVWKVQRGDPPEMTRVLGSRIQALHAEVLGQLQNDLAQLHQAWTPSEDSSVDASSSTGPSPAVQIPQPDPTLLSELRKAMSDNKIDDTLRSVPRLRWIWNDAIRKRAEQERMPAVERRTRDSPRQQQRLPTPSQSDSGDSDTDGTPEGGREDDATTPTSSSFISRTSWNVTNASTPVDPQPSTSMHDNLAP